jgi:peroxiredoxin
MVPPVKSGEAGSLKAVSVRGLILAAALAAMVAIFLVGKFVWAPTVPDMTFVSIKGEKIATAGLRGRVVVVNFWATDCVICMKEMPELVRTYERHRGKELEFVAVAMRHDPPNRVADYAERNRLPFKVALDLNGEHAVAFGSVRFTPTTFVIDKRGKIVARIQGEPDFAKLNALIEEKLKEPA